MATYFFMKPKDFFSIDLGSYIYKVEIFDEDLVSQSRILKFKVLSICKSDYGEDIYVANLLNEEENYRIKLPFTDCSCLGNYYDSEKKAVGALKRYLKGSIKWLEFCISETKKALDKFNNKTKTKKK